METATAVESSTNETVIHSKTKPYRPKIQRTLLPTIPPISSHRPSFLLGVMVDAGRHEFSVDWLQSFMTDVHRMGFNAIHLTLTNDQRFAFTVTDDEDEKTANGNEGKLASSTTITMVKNKINNDSNNSRKRASAPKFTTRDLKCLAQHARSLYNMTILPEVSLPFFAASWVDVEIDVDVDIGIDPAIEQKQKQNQYRLAAPPCPHYACSQKRAVPMVGTNFPLDIRHIPQIKEVISRILRTVVRALDEPAYLHLGARSSSSSTDCWKEVIDGSSAEERLPDYDLFEKTLAAIVSDDLGYRPQVIRGVDDSDSNSDSNAYQLAANPIVSQYQEHQRVADRSIDQKFSSSSYILQPKELNMATTLIRDHPTGWDVYQQTLEILRTHQTNYEDGSFRGMIISTEAMHPRWFEQRNVMGRLLAVSMAVRDFANNNNYDVEEEEETDIENFNNKSRAIFNDKTEFEKAYILLCDQLFPNDDSATISIPSALSKNFCRRLGGLKVEDSSSVDGRNINTSNNREMNIDNAEMRKTIQKQTVTEAKYKRDYSEMWKDWAGEICDRFTETREELKLQTPAAPIMRSIQDEAFARYWQDLNNENENENTYKNEEGIVATTKEESARLEDTSIDDIIRKPSTREDFGNMRVPFRGLIVDLVDNNVPPKVLQNLMEQIMVPLGLNTLQLSLMNRLGCSLQLKSLEQLYHLVPKPRNVDPLSDDVLRQIVAVGDQLGIELIPEISVTTQATGWYHAGFLVECPNTLCSSSSSENSGGEMTIANDVNRGALLPVVLNMIRQLHEVFNHSSSSFLHLGSDERKLSQACWNESGKIPNYNNFEKQLYGLY